MNTPYPAPAVCQEYLAKIENEDHRAELAHVLGWVAHTYPELDVAIKWNQPMFTHHGTFILGFSAASKHYSVSPEVLDDVIEVVKAAGLSHSKMLFRVNFGDPVPYDVLRHCIDHNMAVKADMTTFWRR